jgi:hypothetical protein
MSQNAVTGVDGDLEDPFYELLNLLPPSQYPNGLSSGFTTPDEYTSIHAFLDAPPPQRPVQPLAPPLAPPQYQFEVPTFNIVSQPAYDESPATHGSSSTQSLAQQLFVPGFASGDALSLNSNNLQQLNSLLAPPGLLRSNATLRENSVYSDALLNAASPYMDAVSQFLDYGNPPELFLGTFDTEIALGGSILSTNLPAMDAMYFQRQRNFEQQQLLEAQFQRQQMQAQAQAQVQVQTQAQTQAQAAAPPAFTPFVLQHIYQKPPAPHAPQPVQQPQPQPSQWPTMLTENNLSRFQSVAPPGDVVISIEEAPAVTAANHTPSLFSNSSQTLLHTSPHASLAAPHAAAPVLPHNGGASPLSDYSDSLKPEDHQTMKLGRRRAHLLKAGTRSRSRSRSLSRSSPYEEGDEGDDDDDESEEYDVGPTYGARGVALREKMLELASPNQPSKRSQKHPSVYACHLCEKRFTRPYNLKSHLRTHTDDRPFICNVCGKAFARQHDRKRHEDLHTGEKKFQCKGVLKTGEPYGCGKKFARADALRRHFQTEAGKECIRQLLEEDENERDNPSGVRIDGDDDDDLVVPQVAISPAD